jgi:hypothetical protein
LIFLAFLVTATLDLIATNKGNMGTLNESQDSNNINNIITSSDTTNDTRSTVMDSASTLDSLGTQEPVALPQSSSEPANSNGSAPETQPEVKDELEPNTSKESEEALKRYLPEHKKPDAAPTFPEKVRKTQGIHSLCQTMAVLVAVLFPRHCYVHLLRRSAHD